jgi:glutamine synthetase
MTTIIEYVWLGGKYELRSKTRVLSNKYDYLLDVTLIPKWNYDGSSTYQVDGSNSEIIIVPKKVYPCPFRKGSNLIVLCDSYYSDNSPTDINHRVHAESIFNKKIDEKPWYGIEQEFFLMNNKTDMPLGFDNINDSSEQGQYYCSVGAQNCFGRTIIEESLINMLHAGLTVSGINAEVAPGQWEYQIGPVEGIDAADQLWISRYILEKTAEKHNTWIEYNPKPLDKWNGSGCHTNFSTLNMRKDNGIEYIHNAIKKLEKKHNEHMEIYGIDNHKRMTGIHETASFDKFSYGRADRGASIRIGNDVYEDGKGYFEDRRPASNMDPYQVTAKIFETCCL